MGGDVTSLAAEMTPLTRPDHRTQARFNYRAPLTTP